MPGYECYSTRNSKLAEDIIIANQLNPSTTMWIMVLSHPFPLSCRHCPPQTLREHTNHTPRALMRRQSSVVSKSIPVGKRQDILTQANLFEWLQNVFGFVCRYHNRINHQWKQIHTPHIYPLFVCGYSNTERSTCQSAWFIEYISLDKVVWYETCR